MQHCVGCEAAGSWPAPHRANQRSTGSPPARRGASVPSAADAAASLRRAEDCGLPRRWPCESRSAHASCRCAHVRFTVSSSWRRCQRQAHATNHRDCQDAPASVRCSRAPKSAMTVLDNTLVDALHSEELMNATEHAPQILVLRCPRAGRHAAGTHPGASELGLQRRAGHPRGQAAARLVALLLAGTGRPPGSPLRPCRAPWVCMCRFSCAAQRLPRDAGNVHRQAQSGGLRQGGRREPGQRRQRWAGTSSCDQRSLQHSKLIPEVSLERCCGRMGPELYARPLRDCPPIPHMQ